MKCPFPGMDPYLERHWEDFQPRLIGYIRDDLQPRLPEDLVARMNNTIYVEDIPEATPRPLESFEASPAPVSDPIMLQPIGDPIRHRAVLVYDSNNRLITTIEVLAPWTKSPENGLISYLNQRDKYINSQINLVEIDLVRAGNWTTMIGPHRVPKKAMTTYRVTVVQPEAIGLYLYPVSIRAKLPTIKVPLRPKDSPAKLNLQELIEKAYVMGRYNRIDYTEPCTPPLIGPEKEWADEVLRAAGKL